MRGSASMTEGVVLRRLKRAPPSARRAHDGCQGVHPLEAAFSKLDPEGVGDVPEYSANALTPVRSFRYTPPGISKGHPLRFAPTATAEPANGVVERIDGVEIDPAQTLTVPSAALGLLPLQIERTTPISEGNERRAEIDYYKYEYRPTTRGEMYPE